MNLFFIALSLGFLTQLSCKSQKKEHSSNLLQIDGSKVASGSLGQAYDKGHDTLLTAICIKGNGISSHKASVIDSGSFYDNLTSSQLRNVTGSLAVGISIAGIGLNVSVAKDSDHTVDGTSITTSYVAKVSTFEEKLNVGSATLSDYGRKFIHDPEKFYQSCGDEFISRIEYGAFVILTMKMEFVNTVAKAEFQSQMGLSLLSGIFNIELDPHRLSETTKRQTTISINLHQAGGGSDLLTGMIGNQGMRCGLDNYQDCKASFVKIRGYIDNNFLSSTSDDTQKYAVLNYWTIPYRSVGSIKKELKNQSTHPVTSTGALANRMHIHSIQGEYRSQRYYLSKASNLLRLGNFLPTQIPALDRIRSIKEAAKKNISLLESAFGACMASNARCKPKAMEALKALIPINEKELDLDYSDIEKKGTGLTISYYGGRYFTKDRLGPVTKKGVALPTHLDFDNFQPPAQIRDPNNPRDFAVRLTGLLKPLAEGWISFKAQYRGRFRFWVKNNYGQWIAICDDWGGRTSNQKLFKADHKEQKSILTSQFYFQSNRLYEVRIEYVYGAKWFHGDMDPSLVLYWGQSPESLEVMGEGYLYPYLIPLPDETPIDPGVGLSGTLYKENNFQAKSLAGLIGYGTVNYDWNTKDSLWNFQGSSWPQSGYSIRWSGTLRPDITDKYTFYIFKDDGARLFIDGKLIIDQWQGHGQEHASKPLELIQDRNYDIVVEYYQRTGPAYIQLRWEGQKNGGLRRQFIDPSNLYPNRPFDPQVSACIYEHPNYGGRKDCFGPNSIVPKLEDFRNRLSSVSSDYRADTMIGLIVYSQPNFRGKMGIICDERRDLRQLHYLSGGKINDSVRSMKVLTEQQDQKDTYLSPCMKTKLRGGANGSCLDGSGHTPKLGPCDSAKSWNLLWSEGGYQLKDSASSQCLTLPTKDNLRSGIKFILETCNKDGNADKQLFKIDQLPNSKAKRLTFRNSAFCLESDGTSLEIRLSSCRDHPNQSWTISRF